jgi:hypothetical protein
MNKFVDDDKNKNILKNFKIGIDKSKVMWYNPKR